ncbi:hypothetical protein BDW72DRAFT_117983 [Aspergillus terricola var. indicus]
MVDRRSDSEDGSRAKRQKMDKSGTDPRDNPYLAHIIQPLRSCSDIRQQLRRRKRLKITSSIRSQTGHTRASTFRS